MARVSCIIRVLRAIKAARVLTVFIVERRTQSAMLAAGPLSIILVFASAIAVLHFEAPLGGNTKTAPQNSPISAQQVDGATSPELA